ncbi:hypothetical protein CBS101457_001876 [Exobasidium rhododendri]|nr:hypothetical protein CBS101457_001876 [Exobasidium rhododendri]
MYPGESKGEAEDWVRVPTAGRTGAFSAPSSPVMDQPTKRTQSSYIPSLPLEEDIEMRSQLRGGWLLTRRREWRRRVKSFGAIDTDLESSWPVSKILRQRRLNRERAEQYASCEPDALYHREAGRAKPSHAYRSAISEEQYLQFQHEGEWEKDAPEFSSSPTRGISSQVSPEDEQLEHVHTERLLAGYQACECAEVAMDDVVVGEESWSDVQRSSSRLSQVLECEDKEDGTSQAKRYEQGNINGSMENQVWTVGSSARKSRVEEGQSDDRWPIASIAVERDSSYDVVKRSSILAKSSVTVELARAVASLTAKRQVATHFESLLSPSLQALRSRIASGVFGKFEAGPQVSEHIDSGSDRKIKETRKGRRSTGGKNVKWSATRRERKRETSRSAMIKSASNALQDEEHAQA